MKDIYNPTGEEIRSDNLVTNPFVLSRYFGQIETGMWDGPVVHLRVTRSRFGEGTNWFLDECPYVRLFPHNTPRTEGTYDPCV